MTPAIERPSNSTISASKNAQHWAGAKLRESAVRWREHHLANYDEKAHEAIRTFWRNRDGSAAEAGRVRQDRPGRTRWRHGGEEHGRVHRIGCGYCPGKRPHRSQRTFRAPRRDTARLFPANETLGCSCDQSPRLVAALEFKSQVGPSFGNNFNNRTEEASARPMTYGLHFAKERSANSHDPSPVG